MANKKISSIIAITAFLLTFLGVSFAYFIVNFGAGSSTNLNVESKTTDKLYFVEGQPINIVASSENFGEGMGNLSDYTVTSGAVDNNWVKFADIYWRIVRVNGNNSVKLIYSGTTAPTEAQKAVMTGSTTQIGIPSFNSIYNSAECGGYMYTLGSQRGLGTASAMKTYLENWYSNNLASYDNKIADTIFCNDRSTYSGTGIGTGQTIFGAYNRLINSKIPNLVCPHKDDAFTKADTTKGNGKSLQKVGLLTADEASIAGLITGTSTSSNYLYTNSNYWLGLPYNYSNYAYGFRVNSSGNLNSYVVNYSYGARAVVSLSSDISSSTGNGTWNNPYVIN